MRRIAAAVLAAFLFCFSAGAQQIYNMSFDNWSKKGVMILSKDTGGYIPFEIKLDYVSDATPTYAFISVLSSRWGEFFTGSSSSVLYVDEFRFNY